MAKVLLRLAIVGLVDRGVARRVSRPILSASADLMETDEESGIDDQMEQARNSVFQQSDLGAWLNDVTQCIQKFVRTFQTHTAPLDGLLDGRAVADLSLSQRGTFQPLASTLDRTKKAGNRILGRDSSIPSPIVWLAALCCVIVCALTAFCCCARSTGRKRKQFVHNGKVIYEWEQFEQTMMMYVAIPEGIGRDDLDIGIEPRQITIGRKGMPAFIRERLYLLVDEGKSSWKVDRHELEICFVKLEPTDWPGLLLPHVRLPENRR